MGSAAIYLCLTLLIMMAHFGHQQSVCSKRVTRYRRRSTYSSQGYSFVSGYHNCNWGCRGVWLRVRCGWSRCARHATAYRSRLAGYASDIGYTYVSVCCAGYQGVPPNCKAVCSQGCYNGGTCTSPGTCSCATGWTGYNCRTDIDECRQNTHTCSQVCANDLGTYHCKCFSGYQRLARTPIDVTCTDINECLGNHGCNQTCSNVDGSYTCSCREGYLLQADDRSCTDVNECLDDNAGCQQVCNNIPGSYSCSCNDGFMLDENQHNCSDIKECSDGLHNCDQICIELDGDFECACNNGYELQNDNTTCSDIDECELGISGCSQICSNTNGSFVCSCMMGYNLSTEDQRTCLDINECTINNGGCEQVCINIEGSHRCACYKGYSYNEESGECAAQPCPTLMMPLNGNISCNGTQTTGTACSLECKPGYMLSGSSVRTCLPTNEWSGNSTSCEILHCERLNNPENGNVILPCDTKYGTVCNVRCSEGYYTDIPNPVQICRLFNGTMNWSDPPQCNEIQACTPDPCQHGGKCLANEDRTFTCNCTGTMYAGTQCEIGIVNIQEYPRLAMNKPYTFTITASPDEYLNVFMFPDDRSSLIVNPSQLEFSRNENINNFTITSKRSGRFLLHYRLSGESASDFMQLQPSNIIVIDNQTLETSDYFTSRGLQQGLLQPGCCTALSSFLEYQCPLDFSTVKFNASCAWNLKGLYSTGIVFSDHNGVNFPVAIGGIKFGVNFDLSSLNVFELRDQCMPCSRHSVGRVNDGNDESLERECSIFKPSVNDVLSFLEVESLAYTYFYHSHQLLPRWLRFNVTSTMRIHTSDSYKVTLVESSEVEALETCNITTTYTNGLYSVLMYSGVLNISVNSEEITYTPESQSDALCFAVNLCEGTISPLSISITKDVNDLISELEFMKSFKAANWDINFYSISISNSTIPAQEHALQSGVFWNGVDDVVVSIEKFSIVLSDDVFYSSTVKDFGIHFSFTGKTYLLNDQLEMIHNEGLNSSWIGYMTGQVKFHTNIINNKTAAIMKLRSQDDHSRHTIFTGEEYTSRRCQGCINPAGISLNLIYHSSENSKGFFSQLFTVPPKLEFGLPTQFSCSMDTFLFLSNSLNIDGVSYKSKCLQLNLGMFPFQNLENVMHIFEECSIKQYCKNTDFTNTTNLIIRSYFPQSISQVDMGYFMKLLPASSTDNSAFVATFSKENLEIAAKLFNVQIVIFDTEINTVASINGNELSASFVMELHGKYLSEVTLTMQQTSSWNGAPIVLQGRFLDAVNNIPTKLEDYIAEHLRSLYTRSLVRVRNSETVYNKSLSQQITAIENYNKINDSKASTDALYQATSERLYNQQNVIRNISDELADANEEIQELQSMINNVCMIRKCEEICVPHEECSTCQLNVDTLIQGRCRVPCTKTVTVKEVKEYVAVSRWQYIRSPRCGIRISCFLIICAGSISCGYRSVCVRLTNIEPVFEYRTVTVNDYCDKQCPANLIQAPVRAQCCAPVGCAERMQDYACANSNEQCRSTRNVIYESLSNEQAGAAELLQRLDEENEKEATMKLQLAQLTIRKNSLDRRVAESEERLSDADMAVELASDMYEKIHNATNLDQLERLQVTEDNTTKKIKVSSVLFNTTIISESPTVLVLNVSGQIPHLGYNFTHEVIVDFNRLDMSLREAAVEITDDSIIGGGYRSKRSTRYKHQTEENNNELQFQARCTDLKNLIEYIKTINHSIAALENVTTNSINNVVKGRENLTNLITEYTELYTKAYSIETGKINEVFNNTINITDNEKIEGSLSNEELQNLNLMREYLDASGDIDATTANIMFTTWQSKMEMLHNETSSAAGHECSGFSDCLQEITVVLEDILLDTPLEISNKLLQQFSVASEDLLALALLQNGSLQLAIQKSNNFFNIISDTDLNVYWCATPPVITEQPVLGINPRENTTAKLSCKVISDKYTTYKWKKNGNELPNQKNSTFVLKNAQLRDSGNYTCEITNHVGTVKSTIATVDVQQFPWFFLLPENVDVYNGDVNGARFTSNATGWPYPGFRWYFKSKDSKNFTQIPDEDQNEYFISNPQPQHEGSYYCEAFNEQGNNKSNIVNLTILDIAPLQLSQSFSVNFTSVMLSDGSGSGYQSAYSGDSILEASGSGSGRSETSGSFDNSVTDKPNKEDISEQSLNISNSLQPITDTIFAGLVERTIISATDFISNTLENISVSNMGNNLSLTFTIFSKKLNYPNRPSSDEFVQLASQARIDWFTVTENVKKMLTQTSIVVTYGDLIYNSEPNSTIIWSPHYTCPLGKQISSSNNFLCVSCAPGSRQITEAIYIKDSKVTTKILQPTCKPCPMGYYQSKQGQTSCEKCPPGYTTQNISSRLFEDCYKECDDGYYSTNGLEPCSRCPNGTYTAQKGSTMCHNCTEFDEPIAGFCEPTISNPCKYTCEHNCNEQKAKCVCNSGYVLASDRFSCLKCATTNFNSEIISPTWNVAICDISNNNLSFVCSGTMMNDQWVLTSADCVCNTNKDDLTVRNGACTTTEVGVHSVVNIKCLSEHKSSILNTNLALIKINASIVLTKHAINPICLPTGKSQKRITANDQVMFLGQSNIGGSVFNNTLKLSNVTVARGNKCKSSFASEGVRKFKDKDIFCTHGNTTASCSGNRGAGVVSVDDNGYLLLEGVTGRSTKDCGNPESFIVHSRFNLRKVKKWFKKITKI